MNSLYLISNGENLIVKYHNFILPLFYFFIDYHSDNPANCGIFLIFFWLCKTNCGIDCPHNYSY